MQTRFPPLTEADLIEAMAPRPLVWVTTLNADGTINMAPYSALTLLSTAPPVLLLPVQPTADGGSKRTAANIVRALGFVVNLPHHTSLEALMRSTDPAIPAHERAVQAGVAFEPSSEIAEPRLAGMRAALECRCLRHERVPAAGYTDLFIARILALHRAPDAPEGGSFLGALGYEDFVSEAGRHRIEQPYLRRASPTA